MTKTRFGLRISGPACAVLLAAVFGLLENGAHVTVAGRSRKRALALRKHLGSPDIKVVGLGAAGRAMERADILVNCTPVGMRSFAPGSPVPVGLIRRDMAVLDMVYNPLRTRLLAGAVRKGATTVSGLEMFIRQGMESFRLWTGKTFPEKAVREALAHSQFQ